MLIIVFGTTLYGYLGKDFIFQDPNRFSRARCAERSLRGIKVIIQSSVISSRATLVSYKPECAPFEFSRNLVSLIPVKGIYIKTCLATEDDRNLA